jgi:hypothetical protein
MRCDEHEGIRSKLLEPLGNGDGAVGQLLHDHVRPEILIGQPDHREPAQIEVSLVELGDAGDEDQRQSAPHEQVLTCPITVPSPVAVCVVHGMQGSNERIARSMSIDVNCDGSENFSRIGVFSTACS